MDPETWAVYVAHAIKCSILSSVWPRMACSSRRCLRGYVNAVERSSFWLAVDAATLEQQAQDNPIESPPGNEGTWKGRLVWTVPTEVLQEASQTNLDGQSLFQKGSLRILTSAPRTATGKSRLQLSPPFELDETGDTTMVVLDFVGVALWQYGCLKRSSSLTVSGPLDALLQWSNRPSEFARARENVFQGSFPDASAFEALPDVLRQRLDEEQLHVLQGISGSEAPIQFLHALAGTGKTQVLKCLLYKWARMRQPHNFVIVTLRTKELRHEFWKEMLTVLEDEQVMSSGQSPPGVEVAPDEERWTNRVLKGLTEEVAVLNRAKETLKEACLRSQGLHVPPLWPCKPAEQILQDNDLVRAADAYREAGATAMRALWALFRQWVKAELEALSKVSILVCTADVAMKAFAGEALHPAKNLLQHSACKGLWADEAQRLPGPTVAALAANVPSLGLSGDSGQRATLTTQAEARPFEAGSTGQVTDQMTFWADEFLHTPAGGLESSSSSASGERTLPPPGRTAAGERTAPPGPASAAQDVHVAVWKLTGCKRIGKPALDFIREFLPNVAKDLKLMPSHRGTAFRVAYYDSRCGAWWSLDGLMKHLRTNVELRAAQPHILRQVVWNSDVFTALSLIVLEVQQRRRAGLPEPVLTSGEPLVFVGFTLARLKVPFQLVLNGLLSWEPLLETSAFKGRAWSPAWAACDWPTTAPGPPSTATRATGTHPPQGGQTSRTFR